MGEQVPFADVFQIPGVIEAGNYDKFEGGVGQNISYIDNSQVNEGDYRTDEYVDAVLDATEGPTLGWISAGEWVEYSINVQTAGLYEATLRYASGNPNGGGPFHFEIDGNVISPDVNFNTTNDWDNWADKVVNNVELTQGEHVLRLVVTDGEFNLGEMDFVYTSPLSYVPPIADAGENVVLILPATTGTLDGSLSNDPEGQTITHQWEQIYGPSIITFDDATAESPNISNLEEGVYKCQLSVSDGTYSASDEVLVIVQANANSNPSISITAPSDNASFSEGTAITISTSASDLDGTVTLVEFYDGLTKIGEDSTEPFSFVWTDASVGMHQITAVATDNGGAQGTSSVINLSVNEVLACTESDNAHIDGNPFSIGYTAVFETVGNNVTISFELLDTDREGVIAYLWRQDPFTETQMDHVSGLTFSKTIGGQTIGSTINYACKFAYAGGLSVTRYMSYVVGDDCSGSNNDTEAPMNFTANIGTITATSVELLLNGTDDSGTVIYEVAYGANMASTSGGSGVEQSLIITGLTPETTYDFNIIAKDLTGNTAANNPILLSATTTADLSTACSGTSSDAQQGAFSIGYDYSFETNGTDVTFTFKLLDTDKTGVIAYLWRELPFSETPMDEVGELTFSKTISGQTIGESISYACKFAFAGGLAVTTYHTYVVGDDCVELDCMPYGTVCLETDYAANYDNLATPMKSDFIETCQNTNIEAGAKLKLVAKSAITLNAGFEVSLGSEFIAEMSMEDYCDNSLGDTTIVNTAKAPIYSNFAIELYPNPARHHLAITAKTAMKSVTIYNLYGQQVLFYHYSAPLQRIDLNLDLPTGTYLVRAVDERDDMSIKKIAIQ